MEKLFTSHFCNDTSFCFRCIKYISCQCQSSKLKIVMLLLINLNVLDKFQALKLAIMLLHQDWQKATENFIPGIFSGQQVLHFFFLTNRRNQRVTLSAILSSKMSPSRAMLSSSGTHVLNEHTVNIATVLRCTPLWFVRSGSYQYHCPLAIFLSDLPS